MIFKNLSLFDDTVYSISFEKGWGGIFGFIEILGIEGSTTFNDFRPDGVIRMFSLNAVSDDISWKSHEITFERKLYFYYFGGNSFKSSIWNGMNENTLTINLGHILRRKSWDTKNI